jgi:hypothetical protein
MTDEEIRQQAQDSFDANPANGTDLPIPHLQSVIAELRADLAEREAECLKLRKASQNLLDAYLRGSAATEVKAEKAMKEALSTPQSSSYLEQWEKDHYVQVAQLGDLKGTTWTYAKLTLGDALNDTPLYARKEN